MRTKGYPKAAIASETKPDTVKNVIYPVAALQYLIADAALVKYAPHHLSIECVNRQVSMLVG